MEIRLIIAYALIVLLVAVAAFGLAYFRRAQRDKHPWKYRTRR